MSKTRLGLWVVFVFAVTFMASLFFADSPAVSSETPCQDPEPAPQCQSGGCNCRLWCAVTESFLCMGHWYCVPDSLVWRCKPICIPGPSDQCLPDR